MVRQIRKNVEKWTANPEIYLQSRPKKNPDSYKVNNMKVNLVYFFLAVTKVLMKEIDFPEPGMLTSLDDFDY